ncbi:hypothetical protein [Streptomyces sp. 5-6(2022)]|uniref:hypothetical protein n=1 Tax=Streptomyces sp. 5-6(2022) TaxID=2936510 RepID=UPI0023BA31AD|nr:hypothetical protein [Streptomyces sp. 5-6(2022)]
MHEPTVTRIHDATGSHIEPPLDPAWSDLNKLRWHAAVTAHDTGIAATVQDATYTIDGKPVPGHYDIIVGASSIGPFDFRSAWDYLNGVSTGATAASVIITDVMVRAAAEAIEDACLTHIGRDLGTIHRDDIARAGLEAAARTRRGEP